MAECAEPVVKQFWIVGKLKLKLKFEWRLQPIRQFVKEIMPEEALGYVQIFQAIVIFLGTVAALWYYRRDIKQRTFRDSLAMEASLRETRSPLTVNDGIDFEIKILAHLERLEIIASAINKKYLSGIAKEFAEDVLKNDISGFLYIIKRDDREDLISKFVTSQESFKDIARFYRKHQRAINDRVTVLLR